MSVASLSTKSLLILICLAIIEAHGACLELLKPNPIHYLMFIMLSTKAFREKKGRSKFSRTHYRNLKPPRSMIKNWNNCYQQTSNLKCSHFRKKSRTDVQLVNGNAFRFNYWAADKEHIPLQEEFSLFQELLSKEFPCRRQIRSSYKYTDQGTYGIAIAL